MKQCTCFSLKAINCICAEREDENSFAHWFYGAPHRIKYLRDSPVFLAAQEAWDAAKASTEESSATQEHVDLSCFLCGYAQIKNSEYKFANLRTVEALLKGEFCPIYAIPEEFIDSLYTHPPQRSEDTKQPKAAVATPHKQEPKRESTQSEWVGLTDDEIDEWTPEIHGVIRAIEAKLKEKNI